MLTNHILHTSTYATELLLTHRQGSIHSVYRKTINLSIGDRLVAVQAKDSPLSPISLITDMTQEMMADLPFYKGQTVEITKNGILFFDDSSPVFFLSSSDDICNLKLVSSLSDHQLSLLKNQISDVIRQADTRGFDLLFTGQDVSEIPMLKVAKERLNTVSSLLKDQDFDGAARELIRLIGLGIGLTPSGDDFLTGVLAGLILAGLPPDCPECPENISGLQFAGTIRKELQSHLCDTNDISRAFLQCALDGHFSKAVNSLSKVPLPDTGELLDAFLAIGHSSGIDSLCGIYFVLKHICH